MCDRGRACLCLPLCAYLCICVWAWVGLRNARLCVFPRACVSGCVRCGHQVCHPYVAAGVEQHSDIKHSVQGRFYRTMEYMFAISYGTLDRSLRAARTVRRMHNHVNGAIGERVGCFSEQSRYNAHHIAALVWVQSTLLESAVLAYEITVGKLSMEFKVRAVVPAVVVLLVCCARSAT